MIKEIRIKGRLPIIYICKKNLHSEKANKIPSHYMCFLLETILIIGFDLNVNSISLGDTSIVFCLPTHRLENLCQICCR